MKIKAIVNLVLLILLSVKLVYAQQDPQYTQYMYNQNILNPAYAGSTADISLGILARSQWVGLEGAPNTQTFNVHGKAYKDLGLGLSVIHDRIGISEETNAYIDASYSVRLGYKGRLALGVKGGFTFLSIGLNSETNVMEQEAIYDKDYTGHYPNVGAGLYYYTDKIYVGIASPGLLEDYQYDTNGVVFTDVSDKRHFYGTLGYVFDLDYRLKLKPSTMVKMALDTPLSMDLNATLFIDDKYEVGLSWREGDSLDAIIGMQVLPDLRVGYSFDYTLTNLKQYNNGSHELMLLYDINLFKPKYKSPRYF